MKINVLSVVYNSLVRDTSFINSAIEAGLSPSDLIIADNSTDSLLKSTNQLECRQLGIRYVDMNGNRGLSQAYNKVIDLLNQDEESDILVILDQDTKVTSKYFMAISNSFEYHPEISIHVPIIRNATIIMSPRKFSGNKIVQWNGKINEIQSSLACINSGSAIKLSVFKEIGGFDEHLFLDLVDYDFYRRVSRKMLLIKVVDVTLQQQFSGDTYSTYESDLKRYSIYSKDYSYYAKNNEIPIWVARVTLFKRALKLSVHYRTKAFLKVLKNLE